VTTPIFAGAEPLSVSGGSTGVLVLHGFTGNPQSMRPLALAFVKAGFSVEVPLLPGHGTSVEDMIPTRWSDWSAVAQAAYQNLADRYEKVFVAGLSMGGSLAVWLGEQHPKIAGLVLVNPLVDPPAESFMEMLSAMISQGVVSMPAVGCDIAMPDSAELAYDASPLEPMRSMFEAVVGIASRLDQIRCPVLLLNSRTDHVVPSSSGDLLEAKVSGPIERVFLERSYHVATLDYDAVQVQERAVGFVEKVVGP
jgi:carboxylesterase